MSGTREYRFPHIGPVTEVGAASFEMQFIEIANQDRFRRRRPFRGGPLDHDHSQGGIRGARHPVLGTRWDQYPRSFLEVPVFPAIVQTALAPVMNKRIWSGISTRGVRLRPSNVASARSFLYSSTAPGSPGW